jgi:hypothetical protein
LKVFRCGDREGLRRSVGYVVYKIEVKEGRNILRTIRRRKSNWIGRMLRRNCVMIDSIEGEIERRIKVTIRRAIRYKQLLDGVKEKRGYLQFETGSTKSQYGEN